MSQTRKPFLTIKDKENMPTKYFLYLSFVSLQILDRNGLLKVSKWSLLHNQRQTHSNQQDRSWAIPGGEAITVMMFMNGFFPPFCHFSQSGYNICGRHTDHNRLYAGGLHNAGIRWFLLRRRKSKHSRLTWVARQQQLYGLPERGRLSGRTPFFHPHASYHHVLVWTEREQVWIDHPSRIIDSVQLILWKG